MIIWDFEEEKGAVEMAITQLRERAKRSRVWIRREPWSFLFLLIGLVGFLWILIWTILLDNMGFQEKTFWDWMDLLLVPAVLALAGFWLSRAQRQIERDLARRENEADRRMTLDRRRQDTLDSYLDKMTELILENGLGPDAEPDVKRLARTRTIIALTSLDAYRNGQVIQFLRESELLYPNLVVDLGDANLRAADLIGTDLRGLPLAGANLSSAGLSNADLSGAKLRGADLGADLRMADLSRADLREANLRGALLWKANLEGAIVSADQLLRAKTLKGATMPDGTRYEEWIKRQETENGEGP